MEGRKRLSLGLAGAGLIAALTVALVGGRGPRPGAEPGTIAVELDVTIRETAAAVQARADTLAQLPRLGWAVATDADTVRDMTTEELAFRTRPGEHIEIAHQAREGERQLTRLLRLPAGPAFPLPMSPGSHLVLHEGKAHVVAVVPVEPRQRAEELTGLIAVARELDTAALNRRLEGRGARVELRKGEAAIGLGAATAPRGAAQGKTALSSPSAAGVELTVAAPGKRSAGVLFAAIAIALLSLGGAAVLWLRKAGEGAAAVAPREARPIPVQPPPVPEHRELPWEAGGANGVAEAQGTSSGFSSATAEADEAAPAAEAEWEDSVKTDPVVGQVPEVEASARPDGGVGALPGHPPPFPIGDVRRGSGVVSSNFDPSHSGRVDLSLARSGSIPIPSSSDRSGAVRPPPALPPPFGTLDDPRTEEYRALFTEYLRLRRTTGEALEEVDMNVFVDTLKEKRLQLVRELGVPDVRFRLAFDNGKAAIRYVVLGAAKRGG